MAIKPAPDDHQLRQSGVAAVPYEFCSLRQCCSVRMGRLANVTKGSEWREQTECTDRRFHRAAMARSGVAVQCSLAQSGSD